MRDEATWEDYDKLKKNYHNWMLKDKELLKERENVKTLRQEVTSHALTCL